MIIDAHCHVWPDHIAATVLAGRLADLDARHDGTIAGLRRTMDEAGIDRAVCLGVAHAARTVQRTNEFIGSIDRTRFVPFGTVHPELSPAVNLGVAAGQRHQRGKAAPAVSGLVARRPARRRHRRRAGGGRHHRDYPCGRGRRRRCQRPRLARGHSVPCSTRCPRLRLIACHFGGYHRLDEAEDLLVGSRAVLETSWPPSTAGLDPCRIRKIIAQHGAARVVYGSDWPMTDPAAEIAAIRALGLPPEDEAAILGGNLATLLGIS